MLPTTRPPSPASDGYFSLAYERGIREKRRMSAWLQQHWDAWATFGMIGQTVFMMRFLYQWLASERAKRSVIPVGFWYLSIAGGLMTLVYAIHREDPVFIFGQTTGLFIYLRNLVLLRREKRAAG